MALIKCPECGQQVSDLALKCPKCGCPLSNPMSQQHLSQNADATTLSDSNTNNQSNTQSSDGQQSAKQGNPLGCLVFIIPLLIFVLFEYCSNHSWVEGTWTDNSGRVCLVIRGSNGDYEGHLNSYGVTVSFFGGTYSESSREFYARETDSHSMIKFDVDPSTKRIKYLDSWLSKK